MEIKFKITTNEDVKKLAEIVEKLGLIDFGNETETVKAEEEKTTKKSVYKAKPKKVEKPTEEKKEETAAEEKKEETAVESVETLEYEITDVRAKLAEKVKDHRDEIKSKLNALGAANVTNLKPENYSEFMDFLNSL